MAALALIGASSIVIGRGFSAQATGPAQEPSPSKATTKAQEKSAAAAGSPSEKRRDAPANLPTIQLNLRIAGLGTEGCDVEVKPANPSCKFRPSASKHVSSDGYATIELRDVELRGADKTCAMAITVREPGQTPQTIYRGFRTTSAKPGSVPSFTCFISSRMAGVEAKATRK
jgi:hypothetical protein